VTVDVSADSHDQLFQIAKDAAPQPVLREIAEETLHHVQPRRAGGREVHMKTRMSRQPAQSDSSAALQAKSDYATAVLQAKTAAHTEGLQQGAGIGVGATLLLFGLIFGVKRLTRGFTITKKTQARAASA